MKVGINHVSLLSGPRIEIQSQSLTTIRGLQTIEIPEFRVKPGLTRVKALFLSDSFFR